VLSALSRRQSGATLSPARRYDRPARTSVHPLAETVPTSTATVVRLVSALALAHDWFSCRLVCGLPGRIGARTRWYRPHRHGQTLTRIRTSRTQPQTPLSVVLRGRFHDRCACGRVDTSCIVAARAVVGDLLTAPGRHR